MAQRLVFAGDAVIGELRGQPVMGAVGLGHDQQTGRVLVDAMHDAGPFLATDPRQVAAEMVQERIDQRAAGRARGGMHDHAGGLVHDDQVGILVQDLERDGLGRGYRPPSPPPR